MSLLSNPWRYLHWRKESNCSPPPITGYLLAETQECFCRWELSLILAPVTLHGESKVIVPFVGGVMDFPPKAAAFLAILEIALSGAAFQEAQWAAARGMQKRSVL